MMRTLEHELLRALAEGLRDAAGISRKSNWQPLAHQVPPNGNWRVWGIVGGRGSGKTRTGVEQVIDHARQYGGDARVAIGAPTLGDARSTCFEGQSGLMTLYGDEFVRYNRTTLEAWHRSGAYVRGLGSEKPQRWNGPQWTMLWADELALWLKESFDQAMFGLRLRLPDQRTPYCVVTTTPKARKWVKELLERATSVMTHASTRDNPHLDEAARAELYAIYGGTKLGRQELDGHFVLEIDGALWTHDQLDQLRVIDLPELTRIVIGVDPAATAKEESSETGIVIGGVGANGHGYVFQDASLVALPPRWAKKVCTLYDDLEADRVVGEVNNGGDMVEAVIRVVQPSINFRQVRASRGKYKRAEPIAGLYEQGRVHHVGIFPALEDQMCSYVPGDDGRGGKQKSPDRMDALVWMLHDLMLGASVPDVQIVHW